MLVHYTVAGLAAQDISHLDPAHTHKDSSVIADHNYPMHQEVQAWEVAVHRNESRKKMEFALNAEEGEVEDPEAQEVVEDQADRDGRRRLDKVVGSRQAGSTSLWALPGFEEEVGLEYSGTMGNGSCFSVE